MDRQQGMGMGQEAKQPERSIGHSHAPASAAAAAASPLYFELHQPVEFTYDVDRLHMDSLPLEWFVDEVPEALVCCVCKDVARDPPNLEACAHAVCRDCLTQVRRRTSRCPSCRVSLADSRLASQPLVQAMIWQLRVRCVQHDKGCRWQGQLGVEARNLKAHDAVCPFKEAACVLCNETHLVGDMQQHRYNCPQRSVKCASCQLHVSFDDMMQHQPALRGPVDLDLTGDDEQKESERVAATPCAASSSSAAAASSSSSAAAASNAASSGSPSHLLPPFIPPCASSEACPRGCEDPHHPGHALVYLRSQRAEHERTCTQQSIICRLCEPAHPLLLRQMSSHFDAVMAHPQQRSNAKQHILQLVRRAALQDHSSIVKKRGREDEQANSGSSNKKQKVDNKKPFDFQYSSPGEFAALADEWMAMLVKLKEGGVPIGFLLKGALPDEERVSDLHRPEIDVSAGADENLEAELRDQLKELRDRTDAAFRRTFRQNGVSVGQLHLAATKLILTQPGAEAQVVHIKVSEGEDERYSVLLHCNPTAESIRLPKSAADLSLLRALFKEEDELERPLQDADLERAVQTRQSPDDYFASRPVCAGDALLFRADVAHFDPALAVDERERVMLYALYSPSCGQEQDDEQIQQFADIGERLEQLRS